jgi:hypothetical protein
VTLLFSETGEDGAPMNRVGRSVRAVRALETLAAESHTLSLCIWVDEELLQQLNVIGKVVVERSTW